MDNVKEGRVDADVKDVARSLPFWSWNGRLEKDELLRQIDIMQEMGFGGFFMHSRTGLITEYLGKEWFALINACADYSAGKGMETWLYDEDRWPSGSAGGLVSRNKNYRRKFISAYFGEAPAGLKRLAVFYAVFQGNIENCVIKEYAKETLPGAQKVIFCIEEQPLSSWYNGYTYADLLNRRAVKKFIGLTHEKYKKYCGKRLGSSIKGIFTDEPHHGSAFLGLSSRSKNKYYMTPYTPALFKEFKKAFRYDLRERLPELYFRFDGKPFSKTAADYFEILQRLFIKNWAKQYFDWCRKNNLLVTGHVLEENNMFGQAAAVGDCMRYYEYMDYPGIDALSQDRCFGAAKQAVSAARQFAKKAVLSEMYGVSGWQATLQDFKVMGDWQALLGINLRCQHLLWYTMLGAAKRDCPPSEFFQAAWYREYRKVEEYFKNIQRLFGSGESLTDVLVIFPIESVWGLLRPNFWGSDNELHDENIQRLHDKFVRLNRLLFETHIDFDYGDEDILSRIGAVEGDCLRVGAASYKTVILYGCITIRNSTLGLLGKFAASGGKVVVPDSDYPLFLDGEKPYPEGNRFCELPLDAKEIKKNIRSEINIFCDEKIMTRATRQGEAYYLFAINTDRYTDVEKAVIAVVGSYNAYEVDIYGSCELSLAAAGGGEKTVIKTSFPRGYSRLYKLTDKKEAEGKPPKDISEAGYKELPVNIRSYKLKEDNICVLDIAECIFNGVNLGEQEILAADGRVRELAGMTYDMPQPWYLNKYKKLKPAGKAELTFVFYAEYIPDKLFLVVEQCGKRTIGLNGKKLGGSTGKWIDTCFDKIPVDASLLTKGKNILTLSADYFENDGLEAVYLVGNFGVRLDKTVKTLIRLPDNLTFGDITGQGLPFYRGGVEYRLETPCQKGSMLLKDVSGACVKVSGGKKDEQLLAFSPYVTEEMDLREVRVEVVLSNENSFGPVHNKKQGIDCYSTAFKPSPEDFTMEYNLKPQGLLKAPLIKE